MAINSVRRETLAELSHAAWKVRENAKIVGRTAVGCAVVDESGHTYAGCNIEHRFRSHDIHAEVAALSCLVASGGGPPKVVFIAAERDRFTPCGACVDWIMELGGPDCLVLSQNTPDGPSVAHSAFELMPYYPK